MSAGVGKVTSGAVAVRPAPVQIRRDGEIYSINGGWFQARWHFSFDQYYDPDNMRVGTLRVFNHDTLVPGAVWPMHPHRDIEGITYVVAGHFEHDDSLGNDGVLEPGGVQRMTLGSGVLHSERNHSQVEPMQFIQMWIMPAVKDLPPSVEQRQFTADDRHNRLLQVIKPMGTDGEAVSVHQDVSMYVGRLDAECTVEYIFGENRGGYFYLIEGELDLNTHRLLTGDAAKILGGGALHLHARGLSEAILVDTPL